MQYRALDRAVGRLAALGVGEGDRVALVAANGPALIVAFLAVVASGAAAAPLNPALGEAELSAELDDLRAALDRAVDGTDMLAGAQLLDATSDAWDYLGMYREGVARIERYLEVLPVGHARLHARLWNALSMTAGNAGRSVPARTGGERPRQAGSQAGQAGGRGPGRCR